MKKMATKKKSPSATAVEQEEWFSLLTDYDIHLFKSGRHFRLYEKLGAHPVEVNGVRGTFFAVWAPNAVTVAVIGNFNHWKRGESQMSPRWDASGIWELFIPEVGHGEAYKFSIESKEGQLLEKGDPFAFYWEEPPRTASIVWDTEDYDWQDHAWLENRAQKASAAQPYAVYEVHLGSWKRKSEEDSRSLTYRELADELVAHVAYMGFTHVEFLPVMEHPFYGSWGYQVLGYFAPTSRYGTPQEFKYLVDAFHKAGIGVILDWVPSHFPGDEYGLFRFDGTHLFEHQDPRIGFHPDWKSYIYNYGRNEVRSILISNALYWLERYHIDGLRVDAVASMLYLDYSRESGEWIPNKYGGNENLEAIQFLRELNEATYGAFPDTIMIAEESTSWPNVSKPTYMGGLGFGQKWMMGWMHDALNYFTKDPIHRKYHQNEISFSVMYAFTENFMLPLSHDEVVHGKGALISRMPGDEWQRFANMRLLYGLMYMHPGSQLLFMGGEFGQTSEWKHDQSLDWHLVQYEVHHGLMRWVKELNTFYTQTTALYEKAFDSRGFQWIDHHDSDNSVIAFLRLGEETDDVLLVVCNFTPTVHDTYRVGVPLPGSWTECLNSDAELYQGSGVLNGKSVLSETCPCHGREQSIVLKLPPLGISVMRYEGKQQ